MVDAESLLAAGGGAATVTVTVAVAEPFAVVSVYRKVSVPAKPAAGV
jgi:hypothetical protein